jgi:hypothetical protein
MTPSLAELLADWTDQDIAMHSIAVSLGLVPNDIDYAMSKAKFVYWSNNELGNMLGELVDLMEGIGALEFQIINDEEKIRWNKTYNPSLFHELYRKYLNQGS